MRLIVCLSFEIEIDLIFPNVLKSFYVCNDFFRVNMDDFAHVLMTDANMVKLMEGANFCVPSTSQLHMGPSTFWKC